MVLVKIYGENNYGCSIRPLIERTSFDSDDHISESTSLAQNTLQINIL